MYYYEVLVSSPKYHRENPLRYRFSSRLEPGTAVVIPLQRHRALALVLREVSKPSFATKDISRTISPAPLPSQLSELISWLKDYYPAPFGQLMSLILPANLATQSRIITDAPNKDMKSQVLPALTKEQTQALNKIRRTRNRSILLHGDTGTGKTRIYMDLAQEAIDSGKSALILTPEIGLTPQLARTFTAAFPGKTVVMHSELTAAKRRNAWLRILDSPGPLIVIGPRSALFSPLKNIGIIAIDEFHETSYKQEQAPHYQTARVAAKLADLHGSRLILGSATPPLTDYYLFQAKQLPVVRMKERAIKHHSQPSVSVIDLKKRELFQKSPWVSEVLLEAIEGALQRQEQALIFLNRRGTARLVLCQTCGWQALCPRCDLTLTYHGDSHSMQCHTCGFSQKTPSNCQNCSANDIIFRAIGTKSLVAELTRLFPEATIKRFDSDSSKDERLEQHYAAIREGKVDILVGTQMIGKGLDLPRLSILGVALADTSLTFPDYSAEERTYQLLTQVMGRVNRGHIAGDVYVQTYHPDSPLLRAAMQQDYDSFLALQLAERKQFAFPPFRHVLKLTCSRASQKNAEQTSRKLAQTLHDGHKSIEVVGPSPAFIEKVNDRYRWQIIVKSTRRSELIAIIRNLPANWSYDIDPINLL